MLVAFVHMYGPHFLLLYVGALVVAVLGLYGYIKWSSLLNTGSSDSIPTDDPDPAEVAYLQDGPSGLARLTLFSLVQRNYLEFHDKQGFFRRTAVIQQVPDHPSTGHLSPVERAVFNFFETPRTRTRVFPALPRNLGDVCGKYDEKLEERQLLHVAHFQRARTATYIAIAVIVALGLIKLTVAAWSGHSNVGGIILIAIISMFWIAMVGRVERITELGREYLANLKVEREDLQEVGEQLDDNDQVRSDVLLAVALFGTGVLAGTSFDFFQSAYLGVGSYTGWSGAGAGFGGFVGGGCGAGGCGGGGCGGGGCGGGGCGGCGG